MDKKWLAVFTILFLMLFPITDIFAICPSDSLSELKTLASNVNYDYSYTETNNGVIFQVRFTNVHPKLYVYDATNNKSYFTDKNGEVIIGNLSSGRQYRFILKSSDSATSSNKQEVTVIIDGKESTITYDAGENDTECQNIDISNKYINLPNYNIYYKDSLCKGMEEHDICSKWKKNSMNYDEFKKEIEKLKYQDDKNKIEKEEEKEITVLEMLITFVRQNFIIVIVAILLLITIGIMIYKKRKESNFNGW